MNLIIPLFSVQTCEAVSMYIIQSKLSDMYTNQVLCYGVHTHINPPQVLAWQNF
jgi:hypothetical protein